jgi:hypothetical protein
MFVSSFVFSRANVSVSRILSELDEEAMTADKSQPMLCVCAMFEGMDYDG